MPPNTLLINEYTLNKRGAHVLTNPYGLNPKSRVQNYKESNPKPYLEIHG